MTCDALSVNAAQTQLALVLFLSEVAVDPDSEQLLPEAALVVGVSEPVIGVLYWLIAQSQHTLNCLQTGAQLQRRDEMGPLCRYPPRAHLKTCFNLTYTKLATSYKKKLGNFHYKTDLKTTIFFQNFF